MPTGQGLSNLPTGAVSTSQTKLSRYTVNPNLKIKTMTESLIADKFDAAEDEQAESNDDSNNFDQKSIWMF